jgi:release factor glutamine methyltransferase
MDDSVFDQFWSMVLKGIPLEYIVGKKYFYNSYIYLSSGVFIPRSESELIVDKVVSLLKKRSREELYLLDVCTGPGTLLLSILKNIHQCPIYGIGVDISPLALDWARKNTLESRYLLSEGHQCHWMLSDRLSALDPQWRFDVIVSNPPYIPRSRQDSVHLQVQTYEPHEALFLEDEHYEEWFQLFFTQVKHFLKPHGLFMMEGHENCLQKLVKIGKDVGLNSLVIEKDFSEQDRFLWMY